MKSIFLFTVYEECQNQNLLSIHEKNSLLSIQNGKEYQYTVSDQYIGLYYKTNMLLTNKSVKGSITPTWWNPYYNIYNWNK